MSINTALSLEEALEVLRTETLTHGNEKVRVIDVLYMLANMSGRGGTGTPDKKTQAKIDKILQILSSNDENFDTLQEIVDGLKNVLKTDLSNFPEESKAKLQELLGATESEATASGSAFERE